MAGRYGFGSVGAAGAEALRRFLTEKEVRKRLAFQDQMLLNDRMRQQAKADMELARQTKLDEQADATRLASILGPDADLNAEQAATLRAGGYSVGEQQSLAARDAFGNALPQVGTGRTRRAETVTERLAREQREQAQAEKAETRKFRDEQADAERAFRGEQAAANRAAAKERADADRDVKALIAQMSQSNNLETRALGNELKRLQIAAAEEKLAGQKTERENVEREKKLGRQSVASLARDIKTDPNMAYAVGPWSTRNPFRGSGSAEVYRKVNQLRSMLSLEARSKLKGSGAISDYEARTLADAMTRLDASQKEEDFNKELDRIIDIMGDGDSK